MDTATDRIDEPLESARLSARDRATAAQTESDPGVPGTLDPEYVAFHRNDLTARSARQISTALTWSRPRHVETEDAHCVRMIDRSSNSEHFNLFNSCNSFNRSTRWRPLRQLHRPSPDRANGSDTYPVPPGYRFRLPLDPVFQGSFAVGRPGLLRSTRPLRSKVPTSADSLHRVLTRC